MHSRKVIIIGGGLAGITAALAIKRISDKYSLNIETVIFEKSQSFVDTEENNIASSEKSTDLTSFDSSIHSSEKHDDESSTSATTCLHKDNPYTENGPHYLLWKWSVKQLLELGVGKKLGRIASPVWNLKQQDAENLDILYQYPPGTEHPALNFTDIPPLVATRHADLLRVLMMALGEKLDSDYCEELVTIPSNNNDTHVSVKSSLSDDLARSNWFKDQKFHEFLPMLRLGYELESFIISASTGYVTAKFTNGHVETGLMMIGADGQFSRVRSLLNNGRAEAEYTGNTVFSGTTRLYRPPLDIPTEHDNGNFILDMSRDEIMQFIPEQKSVSLVGKGVSFGCTNLGSGMLGWNLVVNANEPGAVLEGYALEKTRQNISKALSENPKAQIITPAIINVETDDLLDNQSSQSSTHSTKLNTPIIGSKNRDSKNFNKVVSTVNSPVPIYSSLLLSSDALSGQELRTIALRNTQTLPQQCQQIISRVDASLISVRDSYDLHSSPLESCTSPNYHPGRVVLIGDAAHPNCIGPHGNESASLAIADAIHVAKLFGRYINIVDDSFALEHIATEIDKKCQLYSNLMKSARWDNGLEKMNGISRKLWKFGYAITPANWTEDAYQKLLTRGELDNSLPSLL